MSSAGVHATESAVIALRNVFPVDPVGGSGMRGRWRRLGPR